MNRPLFLSLVALVVLTAAPVWAQGDATVVIEAAGPAITPVQNRGPLARQPRPLPLQRGQLRAGLLHLRLHQRDGQVLPQPEHHADGELEIGRAHV